MGKLAELSNGTKLLLGGGLLLFIDLFLDWQQACAHAGGFSICGSSSGWHGVGVVVGLLVIALLLWEGLRVANITLPVALPASLTSAGLAAGLLLFTIIKFLVDNEARHWPSWVGLILAIAIAVGGWLRLTEPRAKAPEASLPT